MSRIHPELLPYTSTERLKAAIRTPGTMDDDWFEMTAEFSRRCYLERTRADSEQVYALLASKWTFEIPHEYCEPMSFSWRSPPKGKRSIGRKYLSTNQAFNAMRRT